MAQRGTRAITARDVLHLLYRLNGLVAEQVGRDRVPWSTERYCEKPDSGLLGDLICVGKSLILGDLRGQIPYAAKQGNKPGEEGDKIDDQRIKSAEHGKAPQVRSGRLVAGWGSLGCGRSAFSISAITLATGEVGFGRDSILEESDSDPLRRPPPPD
jgi:hypothetical protein